MDGQLVDTEAYKRVKEYRFVLGKEQERPTPKVLSPPRILEDVEYDARSVADTEHPNGTLSPGWPPIPMPHLQRLHSYDATVISEPGQVYRSRNLGTGQRTVSSEPFRMERPMGSPPSMTQTIQKKASWLAKLGRRNRSSLVGSSSNGFSDPLPESRRGRRVDSDLHSSINFSSPENLNVPPLVRAAQAGSVVEVEQLLDRGTDIEMCHASSGRNALAVAAHCGNDAVVSLLLQYGAKSNLKDASRSTCLHLAASRGHAGSVRLLLQEGAMVEERNAEDQTPLWIASRNGHLETVQLLVNYRAKVNTRAHGQLTSLHAAAKSGDAAMIDLLISHGAHADAKDDQLMTALHYACEAGHKGAVQVLLGKHADIEARGRVFQTPIICAASAGQVQIVDLLLKRKASLKAKADKGMNSLHWASHNGHVEVVDLLISKKMPINSQNGDGKTSLQLAIVSRRFDVVEYLLRKKADTETRCLRSLTALHYACAIEEPGIVRILLGAGAQYEATTPDDGRPLHIAVSHGTVRTVRLLLERGVNMEARDKAEDRPLCLASFYGHAEIVEMLLDFGSPMRSRFSNRPKSHEDSPLCVAARQGHLNVCSMLIGRGASVRQKDELLWPPLRYAAYYGHPEILQLFLSCGAQVSSVGASGGWGFEVTASRIGFAMNVEISEERKRLVRELLEDAEVRERTNREDQSSHAGMISQPSRAELTGNPLPPYMQEKNSTKYELLDKKFNDTEARPTLDIPLPKYQVGTSVDLSVPAVPSPKEVSALPKAFQTSQPVRSVSHVSALSGNDGYHDREMLSPDQIHEMSGETVTSSRAFDSPIPRSASQLRRERQREMDNEASKRYWEQENARERKRLEQEAEEVEWLKKEMRSSHLEHDPYMSPPQRAAPIPPQIGNPPTEPGDLPSLDIWGTRLEVPKESSGLIKAAPPQLLLTDFRPSDISSRPLLMDDDKAHWQDSPKSVGSEWSWKKGSG